MANIKLKGLLSEAEDFKAKSKESGKIVHFKSKDSYQAALKAGTHDAKKDSSSEKGKSSKGSETPKVNIFNKPSKSEPISTTPKTTPADLAVDKVVYNKRTKTVGIVRMADEYGETKTDADGNVNTSELEPYNPMKYPHQKDAQVAPSTQKEVDKRGLYQPFAQDKETSKEAPTTQTQPSAKSKYDDKSYWKDDEKSDTDGALDYDMSDYDDDDFFSDDAKLTLDRLNKVETALEDDLDLRGNGFETARETGGGSGGFEGPMTIVSKDADYNDEDNFISLSVGSPNNDGKFSIVFANANGEPHFEPEYDALTGDNDLDPQQAYKVTKALMKMPEVQKVLKGEMKLDEFQPIYDKLKSKFSKTESTKLKSMMKK